MSDANDVQTHKTEPADTAGNANDTRAPIKRKDSSGTERPLTAQQVRIDLLEPSDGEEEEVDEAEDVDPADQIEDFDWNGLHERYHEAFNKASDEEAELLREFSDLMAYFKVWAEAGHNHESDRTYHRLRTRMTYVNNSEEKLEKTRQHYIDVVRAFESALALLRNTGFGG
ncbi:hypothetical protein N0V90_006291 [Kalmusia sp. IMI 367209]|nr:hypothetical protein N0V90_006291 [Kalmusia sp. IMI 367209]